jgi:hypothetical protein
MWQIVFPQMANWLPPDEAAQLRFAFAHEMQRLDRAAQSAPSRSEPVQTNRVTLASADGVIRSWAAQTRAPAAFEFPSSGAETREHCALLCPACREPMHFLRQRNRQHMVAAMETALPDRARTFARRSVL